MTGTHMSPEEFRKFGYQVVDWIADYQKRVAELPVQSRVAPGDIRSMLPGAAPETGESFDQILADLDRVILPGITHWQSPNFFAYFPANNSGPSILGELVSAGLGVQGMLWSTSPACTELETHVMDWVVDMFGLPAHFKSSSTGGGVIQDTASSAVLCAMIAARERATNLQFNATGCDGRLVAYTSPHAHSSVEKAAGVCGIGRQNLRPVDVDDQLRVSPAALERAITEDRNAGRIPFFVSVTFGTTSSNAIDSIPEIGAVCKRYGLWLHVDGAMSGTATICPEFRQMLHGLELADSYAFNPHKWMFTNFDCDCFFVADRRPLIQALSILPEYLRNKATESGAVIDYRDWQVQLGRRFRALKLWFVIRHYGVEGLRRHIRRHIDLAQEFARWVKESGDFELVAPAPFNLVCFAHKNGNDFNRRLMEEVNSTGKLFITHTVLHGKYTLRLCVGQTHTEMEHVRAAWELITGMAKELGQPS